MGSVTVLITTFNGSRFLLDTLRSVAEQTLVPDEVIVVDDGSMDGSASLVRSLYPGATVVEQANAGTQAARNTGLDLAKGDYVALLDQDDVWSPGKLELQVAAMESAPHAALCYTRFVEMSGFPPSAQQEIVANQHEAARCGGWAGEVETELFQILLADNPIACSTVLLRRSILGDQRFDTAYPYSADWDLWLRLAASRSFVTIPTELMGYRLHEGNFSRNRREMLVGEADLIRNKTLSPDAPWRAHRSLPNSALVPARKRLAWTLFELSKSADRHERVELRREALRLAPSPNHFLRLVRASLGMP